MFENISSKIKNVGAAAKVHSNLVFATAFLVVLIVIAVFSLTQIVGLKSEVRDYEAKIADMTVQMKQWEQSAAENEVLTAENKKVEAENTALAEENNDIIATNSELERQNGELLKKFDGLSKPQ